MHAFNEERNAISNGRNFLSTKTIPSSILFDPLSNLTFDIVTFHPEIFNKYRRTVYFSCANDVTFSNRTCLNSIKFRYIRILLPKKTNVCCYNSINTPSKVANRNTVCIKTKKEFIKNLLLEPSSSQNLTAVKHYKGIKFETIVEIA